MLTFVIATCQGNTLIKAIFTDSGLDFNLHCITLGLKLGYSTNYILVNGPKMSQMKMDVPENIHLR